MNLSTVTRTGFVYDGAVLTAEYDLGTGKLTEAYLNDPRTGELLAVDYQGYTVWTLEDMAGSIRSTTRVLETDSGIGMVGAWLISHRAFEEWGASQPIVFAATNRLVMLAVSML